MTKHERTEAMCGMAIARLGAERLGRRQWAYYAAETGTWYVVSAAQLVELGEALAVDPYDTAYSRWCAETEAREMAAGWTPDAWRARRDARPRWR